MVRFGILEKHSFPEIPPRVEYHFTTFGKRIVGILDAIEELKQQVTYQSLKPDKKHPHQT